MVVVASGRIFLVLPAHGGKSFLACVELKLEFLTIYEVNMYYEQSEKEN